MEECPEGWLEGVIDAMDQIILEAAGDSLAPVRNPHSTHPRDVYAHLRWMLGEARDMVGRGKPERALQWVGFVQGYLYCMGLTSIQELQLIDILGKRPA